MSLNVFSRTNAENALANIPSGYRRTVPWLPQLGNIFPNFQFVTKHGKLWFWDWAEGSWIYLFSHPAARTPVCTTEIASLASEAPYWEQGNVKVLALTGSSINELEEWHKEIEHEFSVHIDFPTASDEGCRLAKLFGMMHQSESERFPVRKSFILDPSLRVRMIFEYPLYIGRSTEEIVRTIDALQLRDRTGAATPADWYEGDVAIIPDNRSEHEVFRDFGDVSEQVTPYLRVVVPSSHEDEG